jgi:hypothetical protein
VIPIRLTIYRTDDHVYLNPSSIKRFEAAHGGYTSLDLTDGQSIPVRESPADIARMLEENHRETKGELM